jgi:hypothetical protein
MDDCLYLKSLGFKSIALKNYYVRILFYRVVKKQGREMKKLFSFILVVSTIMLTFSGCDNGFERDEYGSIISGGTIKATSIRTGDCFNDLDPEEVKKLVESLKDDTNVSISINHVSAVPCNMPHTNEVFAMSESLFLMFDDYPSLEEISDIADTFCMPEAYGYLGIDSELSQSAKLKMFSDAFPGYYQFFFPRLTSWNSGTRILSCLFYSEFARESSAKNLYEKGL